LKISLFNNWIYFCFSLLFAFAIIPDFIVIFVRGLFLFLLLLFLLFFRFIVITIVVAAATFFLIITGVGCLTVELFGDITGVVIRFKILIYGRRYGSLFVKIDILQNEKY
jgi:hypothetical protein